MCTLKLRFAGILALGLACAARAGDSFLDARIKNPPVPIPVSFADELKNVQEAIGVPLSLPDGFTAFLAKKNPQLPCWMSEGHPDFVTRRDYLKAIEWNLWLSSSYDAKRNVLVMDFLWHKPSSQSARDLLAQLERQAVTKPELLQNVDGRAWTQEFDQLLGCQENYTAGWKLHVLQNCLTMNSSLYIGGEVHQFQLRDVSGADHLAILFWFRSSIIPGPRPKVAAYLFDHDGVLEDGGTFEAGGIMAPPDFKASADGHSVLLHLDIHREKDFGLEASLDANRPSFDQWGDFNLGVPSFDYDPSSKGIVLRLKSKFVDSYNLQLQADHGKFQTTLIKNGAEMHPADYKDSGLSAFDDALD